MGAVSGGCLEADVVERGLRAARSGRSELATYDTSTEEGELAFDLGCHGVVEILIEPAGAAQGMLSFIGECRRDRVTGAIATVCRATGELQSETGRRVYVRGDRPPLSEIGNASLLAEILPAADAVRLRSHPSMISVSLPRGDAFVYVESVEPPVALTICGAGQDALPLARLAAGLGWRLTVMDHRPALLTADRFEGAQTFRYAAGFDWSGVTLDGRTAAVVMSHSLAHDGAYLDRLLASQVRYIGLLGPRRRADRLVAPRREAHAPISAANLSRIHNPAGLDIGSDSPDEIALAVVAEILAMFAGREGGALRRRLPALGGAES